MSTIFEEYDKYRSLKEKKQICHAPFVNMYFNSWGSVGACWLTLDKAPKYPEKSLKEIWNGEYFQSIRENIKKKNLDKHCSVCKKRIEDGVFGQTLARAYDVTFEDESYPSVMEFELSNLCNLACIMCKGTLSSKIRKERENLPALKTPYDKKFVEELREFLPHLKEARFNGGEPFLQQVCWQIWELIAEVNPDILITVATNGTLLTDKMKSVLEKCRFRINVSLDAMTKELYESIRIHSNFETVIENIKFYKDYCKRVDTILSIMVNPMRNNWFQLPDFLKWCNENQYHLWFNTVWRPRHLAIWTLPSREIKMIYSELKMQLIQFENPTDDISQINYRVVSEFIENQLKGWIHDQELREQENSDYKSQLEARKDSKNIFIQKNIYAQFFERFNEVESKAQNILNVDNLYYFLNLQDEKILTDYCTKDIDVMTEWVYKVADYY